MRISLFLTHAVVLSAAACAWHVAESPALAIHVTPTEGSRLAVPGGTIWYRVVGRGTGAPLILLHGSPGTGSY